MSAFRDACRVEQAGMEDVREFFGVVSDGGQRWVTTEKGRLSKELQTRYGDAFLQKNGAIYALEVKIEAEDKHNNFYLETWSNRSRFTRGWLDALDCDFLIYYFIDPGDLYVIPFQKLKKWAFGDGYTTPNVGNGKYKERVQTKRTQLNDTWGCCVPIPVIVHATKAQRWRKTEAGFTKVADVLRPLSLFA